MPHIGGPDRQAVEIAGVRRGIPGGSSVGRRVARRRPSGRPVSGSGPAGLLRARGRDRARHRGRRGRRAPAGRLAARAGRRAARRAAAGARLRLQPLAVEDHLAAAGAGARRRPGGGAAGPHRPASRRCGRPGCGPATAPGPPCSPRLPGWSRTTPCGWPRRTRSPCSTAARAATTGSGWPACAPARSWSTAPRSPLTGPGTPRCGSHGPGSTSATRRSAARCWWTGRRCGVRTCRRRSP